MRNVPSAGSWVHAGNPASSTGRRRRRSKGVRLVGDPTLSRASRWQVWLSWAWQPRVLYALQNDGVGSDGVDHRVVQQNYC